MSAQPGPRADGAGRVPSWGVLKTVIGEPEVIPADRNYRGHPVAVKVGEQVANHVAAAVRQGVDPPLAQHDLELAVPVLMFAVDASDPPPPYWFGAVYALDERPGDVAPWEGVLLYSCGDRRALDNDPRRPWSRRSPTGVGQLLEIVAEAVTFGVDVLNGWGKIRVGMRQEREETVRDLAVRITHFLVVGNCPCAASVAARHHETRARRCAREHSITGWPLGGDLTLGRAAMQAVVGTVNLGGVLAPWLARGMLFAALPELALHPVPFWACDKPACALRGSCNYLTVNCRGSCGQRFDPARHPISIFDDQVVSLAVATPLPFLRCECGNYFLMPAIRTRTPACPLQRCGAPLAPLANGRWPRPKRAWT